MSNFAATVNAAPAYIVNDIYKRFINPNSSGKTEVRMSRIASVVVLVIGILFGLLATRITDVMFWVFGALYGGYVMANVLKWFWWRFNGYGYFWGMVAGILGAMFLPEWMHVPNSLYMIPILFVVSTLGCLLGTFLSPPEDENTLKSFYKRVNPWGWWGPIRRKVMQEDPDFKPNPDFIRDTVNVLAGMVWQLCLMALPVYIVLRHWLEAGVIAALLAVTTIFIKINWYDKLEPAPTPDHEEPVKA